MFTIIAINILFLLLPGILGVKIIRSLTYTAGKKEEFNFFILDSFVLGTISYIFVFLILLTINGQFDLLMNISEKELNLQSIDFKEVTLALFISIVISLGFCLAVENDVICDLARKFKLFNRSAQPHLFYDINKIINSKKADDPDYVNLTRHLSIIKLKSFPDREYCGHIKLWSVHDNFLEIVLKDVMIRNNERKILYEVSHLYLKSKFEDIIIKYYSKQGGNEDVNTT